jgi:carbon-monoxide dehydrogenase medium subunit
MYQTTYHKCHTLEQARALFAELGEPSYMSGGFTLIPAMKNRLAAPENLIDVRAIPELSGVAFEAGHLSIGSATTHAEVAAHPLVEAHIPTLAKLAGSIGDMQVRHMGTIGGSIANNDPAADYPAAVLSMNATIVTDQREIAADDYFDGMYATILKPGEIVVRLVFPVPLSAGYAKFRNPASHYAMAASLVSRTSDGTVRVAVTGASENGVFRWVEAEAALQSQFQAETLEGISLGGVRMMADIHGSAEYRASLVRVMTSRAVAAQGRVDIS